MGIEQSQNCSWILSIVDSKTTYDLASRVNVSSKGNQTDSEGSFQGIMRRLRKPTKKKKGEVALVGLAGRRAKTASLSLIHSSTTQIRLGLYGTHIYKTTKARHKSVIPYVEN